MDKLKPRRLGFSEKIGYALGDGAANIAWRSVATFLLFFYTDVFGLNPNTASLIILITRFSDGIVDLIMGIVCDRTNTKYGKFRPWIFWTAVPLGITLSLVFTTPDFSSTGKVIYAYTTYLLFFVIYTANNIPYGALMVVMTGDDKERTSLGSYRMVGAFTGGMVVQGALLFLVVHFGNINPTIITDKLDSKKYEVTVSAHQAEKNVKINTKNGIALFKWADTTLSDSLNKPVQSKSFSMTENEKYTFIVTGEENLDAKNIIVIDQKKGYRKSIYFLSIFLAVFLIITFATTKERVFPPKEQKTNLTRDFKDLIKNRPCIILLIIGLLFNIYNSIKQGVVLYYFTHYVNNQLLTSSYLIGLMLASIAGAMITPSLSKRLGKRKLFICALIFSGVVNALLAFCTPVNIIGIFTIGIISELGAAIFPTLFFSMLGDAVDYSEYRNGRRATGLVYSAGSFAIKFGGGIAALIIGFVLTAFHYNGLNEISIQSTIQGIVMLMSWIPAIVALIASAFMTLYPLDQNKMDLITIELNKKRSNENG